MDLARALYAQGQRLSTFAARGEIDYTDTNAKRFFRFEVLARRPGSFIFTIFDPFGSPAFKVISDGTSFSSLDYGSAVCTVGLATSENLGRVLPINLTAGDLMSLLTASLIPEPVLAARDSPDTPVRTLSIQSGGSGNDWLNALWQVNLSHGEGSTQVAGFQLRTSSGSIPQFNASYGQFNSVQMENTQNLTSYFPYLIDVSFGQSSSQTKRLVIHYNEVRLGVSLSEEIFSTQVPSGFTRQDI
jgi:outer membrane lipoprotein-sorting protein